MGVRHSRPATAEPMAEPTASSSSADASPEPVSVSALVQLSAPERQRAINDLAQHLPHLPTNLRHPQCLALIHLLRTGKDAEVQLGIGKALGHLFPDQILALAEHIVGLLEPSNSVGTRTAALAAFGAMRPEDLAHYDQRIACITTEHTAPEALRCSALCALLPLENERLATFSQTISMCLDGVLKPQWMQLSGRHWHPVPMTTRPKLGDTVSCTTSTMYFGVSNGSLYRMVKKSERYAGFFYFAPIDKPHEDSTSLEFMHQKYFQVVEERVLATPRVLEAALKLAARVPSVEFLPKLADLLRDPKLGHSLADSVSHVLQQLPPVSLGSWASDLTDLALGPPARVAGLRALRVMASNAPAALCTHTGRIERFILQKAPDDASAVAAAAVLSDFHSAFVKVDASTLAPLLENPRSPECLATLEALLMAQHVSCELEDALSRLRDAQDSSEKVARMAARLIERLYEPGGAAAEHVAATTAVGKRKREADDEHSSDQHSPGSRAPQQPGWLEGQGAESTT